MDRSWHERHRTILNSAHISDHPRHGFRYKRRARPYHRRIDEKSNNRRRENISIRSGSPDRACQPLRYRWRDRIGKFGGQRPMLARFAAFIACMTSQFGAKLACHSVHTCSLGRTSVPARALDGVEVMSSADHDPVGRDRLTATWGRAGHPARCPRIDESLNSNVGHPSGAASS